MISIDVGFGNTKVYDGETLNVFPSIYYRAKAAEAVNDPRDMLLEMDDEKYHVGITALHKGGESQMERHNLLRHKLFILSAICATTRGDFSDKVLLGLPISDMETMKESVEGLKGAYHVVFNGEPREINITTIKVYPQSEAVYNLLERQDENIRDKAIGIIDVGQKTVDLAYYNYGTLDDDRCGSLTKLGCKSAYLDIQKALNRVCDIDTEWYLVSKFLNREAIEEDKNRAFEDMARKILSATSNLGWNYHELDAVYLIGGGSSYIEPFVKEHVKILIGKSDKVIIPSNPVFANVRSYYEGELK